MSIFYYVVELKGECRQISPTFETREQAKTMLNASAAIHAAIQDINEQSYTGDWSFILSEYERTEDTPLECINDTVLLDTSDSELRHEIQQAIVLLTWALNDYSKFGKYYDSMQVVDIIAVEAKEHIWYRKVFVEVDPEYNEKHDYYEQINFVAREIAKDHGWKDGETLTPVKPECPECQTNNTVVCRGENHGDLDQTYCYDCEYYYTTIPKTKG